MRSSPAAPACAPRLILNGKLIGALTSSQPEGGTAEHAPACATIQSGPQPIMNFCIKPHAVGPTQNLFVNDRNGCEAVVLPGVFCLQATFGISAAAPPIQTWCPKVVPAAAAVFTPDAKLSPRWGYVLQPFASVPAGDYGFSILLRVAEDSAFGAGIDPSTRHEPKKPAPKEGEVE